MTQYKLTIKLGEVILKDLAKQKLSLCIQNLVNDGSGLPVANIVASAIPPGDYSNITTFTWQDEYKIAATQNPYKEGGYLAQTSTDAESISTTTKDAFILKNWAIYNVSHDSPFAPANGFAFEPGNAIAHPGASAVIYLTDFSASTQTPAAEVPFYISPSPCVGGSNNKLVPAEQVLVFFYDGARSGSMITTGRTFEMFINLSENPVQTWVLNDKEIWKQEAT